MATYIWHGGLEIYIANAYSVEQARKLLLDEYDKVHPTDIVDAVDKIDARVAFCILIYGIPTVILGECMAECFDVLDTKSRILT